MLVKIVEAGLDVLCSVQFQEIPVFDKFATVANGRIVVWRKLTDKINYLVGEDPNCMYTPPQPNAVTDTGFPATFRYNCAVFKVESTQYNDEVVLRKQSVLTEEDLW